MGSVDPPRRLSSKLSAALCLGINHTNPLINLRPLLDDTNSPLQVIQAKTSREQERGEPRGAREQLAFTCAVRPRENTCAQTARPPPRPDVCSQHHLWLLPQSLQQVEQTEGWENRRSGFPPLPSPATDLILHKRGFFSFLVLLICKSCHPSAHTA